MSDRRPPSPIALTDDQLKEVRQAALTVPYSLRPLFLEQLALELRGKDLGDGLVHRIAYEVARSIAWTSDRSATG
jgi:hypothetical protein